jgi:hypothetical protein
MDNPTNAAAAELTRQTTRHKNNGQSRGETPSQTARRGRPSTVKPVVKPEESKGKPRKVMIPDAEFNRLKMWAWKRGMTFSAVITGLIQVYAPEIEMVTKSAPRAAANGHGESPESEPG